MEEKRKDILIKKHKWERVGRGVGRRYRIGRESRVERRARERNRARIEIEKRIEQKKNTVKGRIRRGWGVGRQGRGGEKKTKQNKTRRVGK